MTTSNLDPPIAGKLDEVLREWFFENQPLADLDDYERHLLSEAKTAISNLIIQAEAKGFERGKQTGYSRGASDNRAPMPVNGMKYCRRANRNVYSCDHYGCR